MALTISSNISSSIAVRSVQSSDRALTQSLSKLSSGSRVQSARDDAASMAIGSRLRAELAALKAVTTNTTQGISMLQIAEGAYARANDMVTRMRALASQAGSANLSNTERGMLDTEFQAIKAEINRVAASTTFGGNQIMNSSVSWSYDPISAAPQFSDYIADFVIYGTNTTDFTGDWGGIGFSGSYTLISNQTNKTYYMNFSDSVDAFGIVTKTTTINITEVNPSTGLPFDPPIVHGTFTIRAGADTSFFNLAGDDAFYLNSGGANSQSFKVSTGNTNTSISTNIWGINATNLGLSYANLTTKNDADNAMTAIVAATDMIAKSRSAIGAAQNRMSSAETNNATAVENLESARSSYMDLDIAAEMAVYTSKQILVQSGISMISQANRKGESLLKLFQ